MSRPVIGVLSYQGDFARHLDILSRIDFPGREVRDIPALDAVDALIIPGGESTTIGMLMERFGLLDAVRARVDQGFPVFGTCAGAILLARDIEGSSQPRIGVMPLCIRRNAYGRQIESFEADLLPAGKDPESPFAGTPVHGVFIRAPLITAIDSGVEPLLLFEAQPVLVRHGALLAGTFHPELTTDTRIHRYFAEQVVAAR